MFQIVCDPSSGSAELCLTEITRSGSQYLSRAWSVFGSVIFESVVCVCVCVYDGLGSAARRNARTHTHHRFKNYAAKHRPITRQISVNHYE